MIQVTNSHLRQIKTHAEAVYPEECCGLLLGTINDDLKIVTEVKSTPNSWGENSQEYFESREKDSKKNRFTIDPILILETQKECRKQNLDIIGIYHSHPDNLAQPSEFDRAIAWSIYSYIIVSVREGKAENLLCWVLDDERQFQPETMILM